MEYKLLQDLLQQKNAMLTLNLKEAYVNCKKEEY